MKIWNCCEERGSIPCPDSQHKLQRIFDLSFPHPVHPENPVHPVISSPPDSGWRYMGASGPRRGDAHSVKHRLSALNQRLVDDCIDLDFDELFGMNESMDFDHGCSWWVLAEMFGVSPTDFLPIGDVGNEHP